MSRKSPQIEWQKPPDIVYGELLSNKQLNATATHKGEKVKGTYFYHPDAGTKLQPGTSRLHVKFEPDDKNDFEPAEHTVEIEVQLAELTVTGITAQNKPYDGATAATLNSGGAKLQGQVLNDNVTFDASAAMGLFGDKNVGNGKPVTVTGITFGGNDIGNYSTSQPSNITADIGSISLTVTGITAQNKPYDGTVGATIDATKAVLVGVQPGESVTLDTQNAAGIFEDAKPGPGKTVTVFGLAIGGPDATNYTLTQPTLQASITAAQPSPGNNLVTAVKRVLCDPEVNVGVTQLLREASNQVAGTATDSKTVVQNALTRIANAFAGSDAVKAKGEAFGGQLLLEIYLDDAVSGKEEPLSPELLRNIDAQLIDANLDLAASTRTYERRGILFSNVEAGTVSVALPPDIAEGAEISSKYFVTDPGGGQFHSFTRKTATTTTTSQQRLLAQGGSQNQTSGFQAKISAGQQTKIKLVLKPQTAQVRCFSCLEWEISGCQQGKQFISSVPVRAMQGERIIDSGQTGPTGYFPFKLRPGWYTFSALQEVAIEGCNYTLASNSPVSAYLGADQRCSDIFFAYKRKGNEIEVIPEICHPDVGDPNEEVRENFPGMQYLLLLEGDPTFVQQQTTADGGALYFRNLAAGTYLLFCQAPATFGSHPVQPVYPENGRLTLRIFAGQTASVPVLVKFRTGTTAPAVLDGFVRDGTGQSVPELLVQIVNSAGCVVAAGLTDATGFYSIQIYSAEDLTIVAGAQKIPVAKSQIQADMKTIGTPALPSPRAARELAVQRSELTFRD